MDDHNEPVREWPHFGAYLREIREKKGLSIEDVCRETRISRSMVVSIESGDRSILPEDFLLKSFMQAMAQACGEDGSKVLSLYLEASPPKPVGTAFYSPGNRKRSLGQLCLILCLVSFVAGGLSFFFGAL